MKEQLNFRPHTIIDIAISCGTKLVWNFPLGSTSDIFRNSLCMTHNPFIWNKFVSYVKSCDQRV